MGREDGSTVFTRLHLALAGAQKEEEEFAAEVTCDDPNSKALYDAFARWAGETFSAARALTMTSAVTEILKRDIGDAVDDGATVRDVAALPFVKPLFELHLARLGVDRLETGARRLENILDYLVEADLQPIAQQYFRSVAHLYLFGFNHEAVIVARSALDSSLQQSLEGRGLLPPAIDESQRRLKDRIDAAGRLRIISHAVVRDAHRLRVAGNHAVHENLGTQAVSALEAIQVLHRVLKQLFPRTD